MAKSADKQPKPAPKKRRQAPAKSLEARENQLIRKAVDEAERQIDNQTASSQLLTHFLKQGTVEKQLEKAKIEKEVLLLTAKTEAIESEKRVEDLYKNALEAMRAYNGAPTQHED